jgi:hypothetical protein
VRTLAALGYTDKGGEYWQPPLGKRPAWIDSPVDGQELPALPIGALLKMYDEHGGDWRKIARAVEDHYRAALAAAMRQPQGDDVGSLEYRGNSVGYIYQKMEARGRAIERAWDALREVGFGFGPDGTVNLSDMIRRVIAAKQAGKELT